MDARFVRTCQSPSAGLFIYELSSSVTLTYFKQINVVQAGGCPAFLLTSVQMSNVLQGD